MDVVHAVQAVCPGHEAGHIVTRLLQAFRTGLGWDELTARLQLLLHVRKDLVNFIRERIVQGYLASMSPSEILSEVTTMMKLWGRKISAARVTSLLQRPHP